ncbi:hypothetical protein [Nonomuraea fuscirosea]
MFKAVASSAGVPGGPTNNEVIEVIEVNSHIYDMSQLNGHTTVAGQ